MITSQYRIKATFGYYENSNSQLLLLGRLVLPMEV